LGFVDEAGGLGGGGPDDLGLGHQPGLLGAALVHEALVGDAARLHRLLGLLAGTVGELGVLPARIGHGALGLVAGARERLLGLGAGVGEQPVGLGVRGGQRGGGVGLRSRAGLL